jgi:alcohol dehydrogenase (cytochrome c)
MYRSCLAAAIAVLLAAAAASAQTGGGSPAFDDFVPVTDAMLQKPDPADWLMWRRTLDGWGYSPLDEIDQSNAAELELVWSHDTGPGNQQATPLVYRGVMYIPNRGDYIQAFDAATGELYWEYQRAFPEGMRGSTNRNIAIYGTNLIDSGGDNQIYAVDARTGELVWETFVHEPALRAHTTSGPIIANGRVIAGRQCQPDATHEACVITAHDAATGKELWRARTIPRPGEPGDETWGDVPLEERWHVGSWMVPSFDPELGLIYAGTSVTIPSPKFQLGGIDEQHLYHNSTLALDIETGEIVWYYQHLIDHWDLDHPFERLLVDTAVAPDPATVPWINPNIRPGEMRRVITGIPGKTGIVYTLDRETGEFLWARETLFQNVVAAIDGATGKVTADAERVYTHKDQEVLVCPSMQGGRNWPAGAYSPRTNAMYVPMQNVCMNTKVQDDGRDPSRVYGLDQDAVLAPGKEFMGAIWAVSAETGATLWNREQPAGAMAMVATGGGLVFGGDVAGHFRAYDETTGAVLFDAALGSPISGYPVSFAADGKQYVAVTTSSSGIANNTRRFHPEVMPEGSDSKVFVFALP